MPPPRQGSAFVKRGKVMVQVRLRAGAPRRFWIAECPARADKVPVDLIHAKSVAADLQRLYDAGRWDPLAAQAPAEPPPPPAAAPKTVREYADDWAKGQTYESAPKDRKVLAKYLRASELGAMRVGEVRPVHVVAWLAWLGKQPSTRKGLLAARSIRNVYDPLRRALDAAVLEELLLANPCASVRKKLPAIVDKDEDAREGWLFSRAEVWGLLSDPRVNAARRVVYAIEFLTGCRPGEFAVLRWRDWDREQVPLTRLMIARAMKSVSKVIGRTKTGARKPVPVHPHLEAVLTWWWAAGWKAYTGRDPEPDDLIVPNQNGAPRNTSRANRDFKRDTVKLGFGEERHHYVTRHTFITQVQDDGADGSVIKWVTHAPPKSAHDGYARSLWTRLCEEMVKLRVGGPIEGLTPRSTPPADPPAVPPDPK